MFRLFFNHKEYSIYIRRYYIYLIRFFFHAYRKSEYFFPRFWNQIPNLFGRFWPGKWKSTIFLPWNEKFYFQTIVSVSRPPKIRIKRNRISPIKLTYTVGVLQKRRVWRTANRFFCPIRGWKNGGIRCERIRVRAFSTIFLGELKLREVVNARQPRGNV